jgi:hypothetical protein
MLQTDAEIPVMEAEILFLQPRHVAPATAALTELGLQVEKLDFVDPYGPTVWLRVLGASELDEHSWFDWIHRFVGPLGGDLVEAGLSHPPQV